MRKPAIPNVKVKVSPKIDWPTKGGLRLWHPYDQYVWDQGPHHLDPGG